MTSNEARKVGKVTRFFRRGERRSVGLFRTTITESFLLRFSPTSHSRLAYEPVFQRCVCF